MKILNPPVEMKLCHAKPGDVLQIGSNSQELYVLAAVGKLKPKSEKNLNGLYSDNRDFYLVSLRDGHVKNLPHLSSRVIVRTDVALVVGSAFSQD